MGRFETSVSMTTIPTVESVKLHKALLSGSLGNPQCRRDFVDIRKKAQLFVSRLAYDALDASEDEARAELLAAGGDTRVVQLYPDDDLTNVSITHNGLCRPLLRLGSNSFYYGLNLLIEECEAARISSTAAEEACSSAQSRCENYEKEIEVLREHEGKLQDAITNLSRLCQQRLDELHRGQETYRQTLAAQKKRDEAALAEMRELQEEKTALDHKALAAEKKVIELEEKLKESEARVEEVEGEVLDLRVEICDCKKTCRNSFAAQKERDESAMAEIRKLAKEKEALQQRLADTENRCLDAESQLGDLEEKVSRVQHESSVKWVKHQEEIGALKAKHQEELGDTRNKLTDTEEELKDLQEDYKEQVDMYWTVQKENMSLKNLFHDLGKKCIDAADGVGDDE